VRRLNPGKGLGGSSGRGIRFLSYIYRSHFLFLNRGCCPRF
jgi:hypothetical protein